MSEPTASAQQRSPLHVATEPGDRIRFEPQAGRCWWQIRARDERWIVATQQQAFAPAGKLIYTVVDLVGWGHLYNGQGNGPVRSSLDTIGGGSLTGLDDDGCATILRALQSAKWGLSRRRVINVHRVEVKAP